MATQPRKANKLEQEHFDRLEVMLFNLAMRANTPKSIKVSAAKLILDRYMPSGASAAGGDSLHKVEQALLRAVK